MDHVLSTHLFAGHRLTTALLSRIEAAGLHAVEIFCAKPHMDWRDPSQISELGHWFRDSKLKLHSLHSPMSTEQYGSRSGPRTVISIADRVKAQRMQSVDEIKRALDVAETVPFRYLIQHLGVAGEEFDMHKVDAAFTALEELTVFARQRGVEILLENIPNELSTAERLLLFDEVTHIGLSFVFDIGHAHLHEGVENAFNLMKERIRSTHVHDNNGLDDQHMFPFSVKEGGIDWALAMELLRSRPGQYPLLLEVRERPELPNQLDAITEVFDRLETA